MLCDAMHLQPLEQIIIIAFNDALHLQNVFSVPSRHVMDRTTTILSIIHSIQIIFFFIFVFVCFSIQLILRYVSLSVCHLLDLISIRSFSLLALLSNLFQFIFEYSFAIWSSIKCGYPLYSSEHWLT